jgi:SAM-dependent methyltransferase
MLPNGYAAGGHDWLATWRRMYDDERAQAEHMTLPGFTPQPDCWAGQAGRFAVSAARAPQPDGFMRFLLPRLHPDDRVVDIGAGTGRYAGLLSGTAAQVVAVEPSPAMREQLERHIAGEQLGNVQVVAANWPAAGIETCDVALAAHVLYGVREIEPFLRAMDTIAIRGCYLLLAFRHPSSFVSPFWQRLYGEPRLVLPGALECLSALYQLGIYAQLSTVPVLNRFSYAGVDEALADLRWRLRTPATPEYDNIIRAAIDELLDHDEDGRLAPRGLPDQAAVVWWEKPAPHAPN